MKKGSFQAMATSYELLTGIKNILVTVSMFSQEIKTAFDNDTIIGYYNSIIAVILCC